MLPMRCCYLKFCRQEIRVLSAVILTRRCCCRRRRRRRPFWVVVVVVAVVFLFLLSLVMSPGNRGYCFVLAGVLSPR